MWVTLTSSGANTSAWVASSTRWEARVGAASSSACAGLVAQATRRSCSNFFGIDVDLRLRASPTVLTTSPTVPSAASASSRNGRAYAAASARPPRPANGTSEMSEPVAGRK